MPVPRGPEWRRRPCWLEAASSWTPAARGPSGPAQHKGQREEGGSGHGGQGPFSHLSTTSPRREAAPFTSEKARREVGGPGVSGIATRGGAGAGPPGALRGEEGTAGAGPRRQVFGPAGAEPPGPPAGRRGAGGPQAWRGLHLGLGSQEPRDPGSPDATRPVLAARWGTPRSGKCRRPRPLQVEGGQVWRAGPPRSRRSCRTPEVVLESV